METALKLNLLEQNAPALCRVDLEEEAVDHIFQLMGWEKLPYRLKYEIVPDVVAYYDELMGRYSTNDQGVINRRKRVQYWVENFLQGICTLETAVRMVRVH